MPEPSISFISRGAVPSRRLFFKGLTVTSRLSLVFVFLIIALDIGALIATKVFSSKTESMTQTLQELNTKRSLELERSILQLPSQLNFVKQALARHFPGQKLFEFLRAHTLKQVSVVSVTVDREPKTLEFKGSAGSFEVLASQLVLLQSKKEIARAGVSDIRLLENGQVGFTIALSLADSFFSTRSD